uniref:Genome polyprotein n=20 Tax=Hedgehog hepatovirus TaxID=1745249 RepID=A0A0S1M392_9PICO|nr:polyprotein [Hedgehog hepatovirus]
MMSHNGILQTVGRSLDRILTLADIEEEQVMEHPDRVSVAGASYFTSVDQSSVHSSVVGSHQREPLLTSVDLPGSRKTQGEKFFLIHTAEWQTTDALFHEIAKLDVVKLLYDQQFAVDGLLRYHTYGRFGLEVQIQINPTTFQQGGLICAMVPADQGYGSLSCLTMYPHGLLNCNINNVVRIKVPFVYTRGAYNFREPQYTIWELTIRVWNRLYIGTGTTPYTSVNILARMVDLELHGLTPVMTQMMRNEFRVSTTENVVNLSNYEDSRAKISLALDQESWRPDSSEAGGLSITNFSTWTSVPTLATQFPLNSSSEVGSQIKVIPVDPFYYQMTNTSPQQNCVTSLASIAQMFCFWRGDLVFDFQAFPTKYHSGRILICFVPGHENMDVSKITLKQATTGPCAVMDITGVNSTMRFRVPWICDTPYRVNRYTKSAHVKGEYTAIGKIIVFVYNRLSQPANVASHVYFNVYMSAVNFECFGPVYHVMNAITQAGGEFSSTAETQQNEPDPCGGITTPKDLVGRANQGKLDLASGRVPTGVVTVIEDPVLAKKIPETFPEKPPGQSRHTSDHMDIRKFMGRAHFLGTFTFNANNMQYTFPISLSSTSNPPHGLPSTLRWFFNLFHLYRGPLDLTVVVTGATDVDGMLWFTPVGLASDPPWKEAATALTIDYRTSLGAVRFNTRRTGNIQMRLPWYSYLYAISGALDGTGDVSDSTFGSISIQISNYGGGDEYLSFSLYLSVTEESQFLFPRAPLNNFAMNATSRSTRSIQDMVESPVDDFKTKEDREFEEELSNEILPIEQIPRKQFPYRSLRMKVAEQRLKYAKEELNRPFSQTHKVVNFVVYEREEGSQILRGFGFENKIYRFTTPSWLERNVYMRSSTFCCENKDEWNEAVLTYDIERILMKLVSINDWQNAKFSYANINNFDEALKYLKEDKIFSNFDDSELELLFICLLPSSNSFIKRITKETGIKQVSGEASELISECRKFLAEVKSSLKAFAYGFCHNQYVQWLKLILKIVKVAIYTYVCYKVNWDPKVVWPIIALLGVENLMEGLNLFEILSRLMNECFEHEVEKRLLDLKTESLGWLRDLTAGISVFKSLKDLTIWLVQKFKEQYDKYCGTTARKLKMIRDHESEIESTLEECDNFCAKYIQDVEKEQEYEKGMDLLCTLRTVFSFLSEDEKLRKFAQPIRDAQTRVHHKIRSLGAINQNVITRAEPVVCYMYGLRGGGKSLTSLALATKICREYGVDPKKNIYTKPVSSDYWDGYSQQLVCIMDDIGQCTDDEDWANFCQLVSGCPLRLNMASLEEKGKHFSSPFIICTSNQADPSPKTVYVKEAISRRLFYKIEVSPTPYYTVNSMLNVALAKKEDAIKDMRCVNLSMCGTSVKLDDLVQSMVEQVKFRQQNMDDFMKLWSEGFNEVRDYAYEEFRKVMKFDKMVETSKNRLSKLFKSLNENKILTLGGVIGFFLAAGVIYGGYRFIKDKFFPEDDEKPVTTGVYHGVTRPKNVVKLDAINTDTQSVVEISSLIHKNLVRFGIGEKGGCVDWLMNALGVRDDWLLIPSHAYMFEQDLASKEFYFERNGTYYSTASGSVQIHTLDTGFQDVVLMKVPNIPKFRDITNHFLSKKDVEGVCKRLATLVTSNQGVYQMVSEGPLKYEEHVTYSHRMDDGSIKDLTIGAAFRGKGESVSGMCGGAVVSSSQKLQNPIVGIHVAGGHGTMISKAIFKEMFEVIDSKLEHSQRITKVEFTQSCVNIGTKTLLNKSPIHDLIPRENINFPASMPFSKKNEIDPIQVMLSKYDVPWCVQPPGYDAAVEFYLEKIQGLDSIVEEQLSLKEAIEGVPGIDALNMKTSAGLPYTLHHLDKEMLIFKDDDGQLLGIHPFLKSRIEMNLACMDCGNEMDVIYMTCPKDELRPLQKVIDSKTRAIEACPLDFTIICRMMWGPGISYFQLNPGFHTGVAVGMDPDSDWDSLFRAMVKFGDYGLDLDFSSFDASVSPFMIWNACSILSSLSGISERQHSSLFMAICYSRHQILNMIYSVQGSMPSGTPCTSLLNSIINNINLFFVFSRIFRKPPSIVSELVKFICYGDDVLIVFNRKLDISKLEKLGSLVVKNFESLCMTVTSSTKETPVIRRISELTFLKRKFYFSNERIRPDIDSKTIWSLVAWQRTNAEFSQNVETASWFAFLKGPEFYSHFKRKMNDMFKMQNLNLRISSYEFWLDRFRELEFDRDMS